MSRAVRQSSPVKNVNQWLDEATPLSPITQARRLIQLEKDWRNIVQAALGSNSPVQLKRQAGQIAGLHNGELIVLVDSPASRAKLKLISTELADALRTKGWQVSLIRTQVQESLLKSEATSVPNSRQLSGSLARSIDESANLIGNLKLRQALKRLAVERPPKKTLSPGLKG